MWPPCSLVHLPVLLLWLQRLPPNPQALQWPLLSVAAEGGLA